MTQGAQNYWSITSSISAIVKLPSSTAIAIRRLRRTALRASGGLWRLRVCTPMIGSWSWGPWFIEDAERRVDALIASGQRFTAIVAANLYMAIGARRALRKARIRIPEDVSLVSFNDHDVAAELSPFLTALSQPIYSMGRIAMGLLLDRISGAYSGESRDVILSPSLVVRYSFGPAAVEEPRSCAGFGPSLVS
jgi:DNA-binding LacI/PurR family transcriptional regulator